MTHRKNPDVDWIEHLAPNVIKLRHGNMTVLYSYDTPVAVFTKGTWYVTDKFWSRTTSKHINLWGPVKGGSALTKTEKVPQEWINDAARTGMMGNPRRTTAKRPPHGKRGASRHKYGVRVKGYEVGRHARRLPTRYGSNPYPEADEGIRPYGPGKFNNYADKYVYDVTLQSGPDEEVETGYGWYGLMRDGGTIFLDHDPMLDKVTTAERALITDTQGVIVHESTDGFVRVEYYDSPQELNDAWAQIEQEAADWAEEGNED